MGTRAMITKNGEPFIATHWDGYPSSLGADLMGLTDDAQIIRAAAEHTIDFAVPSVVEQLQEARIESIAKGNNLTIQQVRDGLRRNIQTAEDYLIGDIGIYDDWAEYQYDLVDGQWRYREVSGNWKNAKAGKWQPLTAEACKQ